MSVAVMNTALYTKEERFMICIDIGRMYGHIYGRIYGRISIGRIIKMTT